MVAGAAGAAFAALFSVLSVRKQDDFGYSRLDLGNMAQTVWNTAHGRILEMSDATGTTYTRLGVHFDPILAALAPLYRAWPDAKLLLIVQALAVAAGAWPAYRIAQLELRDLAPAWTPAALASAFLLYPPLQWATLDEFHPITLAMPLLLGAIWTLRQRHYGRFALLAVAASLCKEEVGFLVGMLGLYAAVVWEDRRVGLLIFAAGFAWSLAAFELVIPFYSPGEEGPFGDRYEEVGGSIGGILGNVLTDPLLIAGELTSGRDLGYLAGQLAPLLALPLLAPVALAVALPELAINLLSGHPPQTSWRFHYIAGQAPFIWWAGVLGLRRLLTWSADGRLPVSRLAPALPLVACLAAGYVMGPLPWWSQLPGGSDHQAGRYSPDARDRLAERVLERVPGDAPISVVNTLGAHVANRRQVALFPRLGPARYVLVDLRNPAYAEANGRNARPGNPVLRAVTCEVRRLQRSGEARVRSYADGLMVLERRRRGATSLGPSPCSRFITAIR